jgi:hypothetical protein
MLGPGSSNMPTNLETTSLWYRFSFSLCMSSKQGYTATA